MVAFGGNALLRRGESPGMGAEEQSLARAGAVTAALARRHQVVVTHGNGPQVGLLALRDAGLSGLAASPLDVLGAETEGMIGYLLERELRSCLPDRSVVVLLTQVQVDPDDEAFGRPTKPIGPVYERDRAEVLAAERGWSIGPDGEGWRRVVPSPRPRRILELTAIRLLVEAGHLVVCAGGGGIPVLVGPDGRVHGVEAVVDKDLSAALLASGLDAEVLLLLTDVDGLYRDWPERSDPVRRITPRELGEMKLPPGSMGPKAEAAAAFVQKTGGRAVIGGLENAEAMLAGSSGTEVVPEDEETGAAGG